MASVPPVGLQRPGLRLVDFLTMTPYEVQQYLMAQAPTRPEVSAYQPTVGQDYGLTGAQILPEQQSEYEPTLAPQQAEAMTLGEKVTRFRDMLPGVIEAAGFAAVPGVGPHEIKAPAPARLRGRPVAEVEQAPTFYSQARTVIEDPKTQGTQTGEAWQRFLTDPKRGVKAEEMEWTGLGALLKGKAGQRVTKDELTKHLDANEIEVKEVTKKTGGEFAGRNADSLLAESQREERIAQQWQRNGDPHQADVHFRRAEQLGAAAEDVELGSSASEGMPKFSRYTLPGAENYREVLLTLPNTKTSAQVKWTTRETDSSWSVYADGKFAGTWYKSEAPTSAEAIADAQRGWSIGELPESQRGGFTSGHWDEPNVLAHLRLSDRKDADGKRTLLVEEIQSDWAQKGRKEGFERPDEKLVAKRDEAANGNFWRVETEAGRFVTNVTDPGLTAEAAIAEARNRIAQNAEGIVGRVRTGVPPAPFVTDTAKWTALGLKRVLKMAADEGYDRIGIVPGAEQAKRYDLSKQVDTLLYKKNPDGTYRLSAQIGGRGQMLGESIPAEKLADHVGKDVADRIISDRGKPSNLGGPGTVSQPRDIWGELSGEGLQVGGEGMKGYYDKIVPEVLNKLAKEYGVKVQIEGGKVDARGNKPTEHRDFDSWMKAKEGNEIPIHVLDVPETMRKQIKRKGFPLYSRNTLGALIGQANA